MPVWRLGTIGSRQEIAFSEPSPLRDIFIETPCSVGHYTHYTDFNIKLKKKNLLSNNNEKIAAASKNIKKQNGGNHALWAVTCGVFELLSFPPHTQGIRDDI
jgi:hypothetical protein